MAENIEETNAKLWEEDTEVSVPASRVPPHLGRQSISPAVTPPANASLRVATGPRPGPAVRPGLARPRQPNFRSNNGRSQSGSGTASPTSPTDQGPGFAREQQNRRGNDRRETFRGGRRDNNTSYRGGRREGGSGYSQSNARATQSQRRDGGSRQSHDSFPRPGPRVSYIAEKLEAWADPPTLLTTQRQREQEAKELETKLRNVYLAPLEEGADPYGTGYIIWGSKEGSPMDLLGFELKALNPIRTAYKVWIEWDKKLRSLKISSRSELKHEARVIQAIEAVRETIAHAKAKAIYSSTMYLAATPSAGGIRSIVLPMIVEKGPNRITDLVMTGEPLSREDMNAWKEGRSNLVQANREKFEDHLKKGLLALAPYKGKMRLQVHFGHVEFNEVHNDLKKGKYSFQKFSKMLNHTRTAGTFQQQFENATIAQNMRKRILAWPQHFYPRDTSIESIEEVQFVNREILFISAGGSQSKKLRIEADIDIIHTETGDEYQIGCRDLFDDDATNTKLEINTIDVEKRVDWAIEVTSDPPRDDWPEQLSQLIKSSVTTRTKVRTDSLGLSYPGVIPIAPFGVYVDQVVVRSTIQYQTGNSGYVVEISIDRTWEGDKTTGEPTMASSVSLFHPYWEYQMESIETKATEAREWDNNLDNFFVHGYETDGLPALREEIGTIQDLLSRAQLAVRENSSD